ncbi:MAG: LPXTG cell wall anchor domain-containing protein [Clostridia bacterium]|nr:LPXTG cell wall anchor domain-containing protein [Clostridia bacterium]
MNIKKVLILFLVFIFFSSCCYANEIALNATGELKDNSDVTIKIGINLGEIEENVYFLQGQLEYDTNIFEKIMSEDIELLNSWHDLVFNPENGKFVIEGMDSSESNLQDVMNIKLKTKNKLTNDSTTIKLKDLKEVGESQIEKELEDATVTLRKPATENFANKILPFTGNNSIIFYAIIIIIIGLVAFFIKKRKTNKKS